MASLLRTILLVLGLAGIVLLIFWRLSIDQHQRSLAELEALNREIEARLEQREAMIDRLSRSRRIARVEVAAQRMNEAGDVAETDILFIELSESGREIARQRFTIPGGVLFIDAWTVKFDHEQVAGGHPLYGRSLVLLRRVYSDRVAPRDGYAIDTPGAIPPPYAEGDAAIFEQRLWEHFWQIATDAEMARAMGVRVAQGEAVYKPVRDGQAFELIVDAAAGISLSPLPEAPALTRGHE